MRPERAETLLLASASRVRARLLTEAGVLIEVMPAKVDEAALRSGLRAEGASTAQAAEVLAETKAVQVSQRFPQRLVLGADQMLDCAGEWLEKPGDLGEAREQLRILRARPHQLHSSAVLARAGKRVWHQNSIATLYMRDFTDEFLSEYLDVAGEDMLTSVGGYKLEAMGAQLFDGIDGDYFAILGLPLLPVIAALREQGLLRR